MRQLLLFILPLTFTLTCIAQTDADKVKETVSKNDIEGHIYFLASDELRGRETGSPEIDIAAAYLANSFRRYGVKPADNGSYYQAVELEKVSAAKDIKIELNSFTSDNLLPLAASNFDFNGDAIFLNYGLEEDYNTKDVKGKLVVVKAGTAEKGDPRAAFRAAQQKRELASKNGATGIVELSSADAALWTQLSGYFGGEQIGLKSEDAEKLVHVWLQDTDGSIEKALRSSKKISGKLSVSGIHKKAVPSRNVVGMVEGTDPSLKNEFVIYSAHYDHNGVGKPNAENDSIYNGARDNAVGTVTVLSAAENIAKYPTKRSALFILFTAEEKGLLGSKWYVEHPVIPLEQMVYCFNSDNGGYNDTSIATIVGLNRTTVSQHIINATSEFGLKAIDDPAGEQGLFDRSDNVSFAAKGIPAPTFSLGFTAFDAEINKYYHQTADNPDTLDYDYLEKFFKSYVMACRLIANDPNTPFWTKGDKYYEIGEQLYKKK
ncbi:M28 family peptidase [Aureibaculum sp. A20]|uniref:M28 family peptidase n=1 Tax=Aureibaculum flavum TaxID=2795986 RepID=A0ABS0WWN4_9FLAO|nr:M28 family peptidase [Aureibaculum flavum]MBJ2176301.1 M28 family peptidase [Aureibaculum flavum]